MAWQLVLDATVPVQKVFHRTSLRAQLGITALPLLTNLISLAAQTLSVQQQQSGDEDLFEYNNQLRHGIFEAYSGILNGMSAEKVSQFLEQPSVVRPLPSMIVNYSPFILYAWRLEFPLKESIKLSMWGFDV